MIDEATVRTALNAIIDPCSVAANCAAGLQDMGLIRRVEIAESPEGAVVRVVIGVTEYGCLLGASFASEAYKILENMQGVVVAKVELDREFDWDPDDMSAAYQARLSARRARTKQLLGLRQPVTTQIKPGDNHAMQCGRKSLL
jgi:metal-sulfur cluster biosynthetic enzyme